MLKLTKINERQLRDRMRVETLPRTFKEAVSACLELKYQYLWVDSICIMQDSPADWQEQAAEMGSVYENTALNLCMAGSANPSEASFTSKNTDLTLPLSMTFTGRDGKATTCHMICGGMYDIDIRRSPLRERGWVFQEWYLAKRSLIFGRMQLWWHCCEKLACETVPAGISGTGLNSTYIEEAAAMKSKALDRSDDLWLSLHHWWSLVIQYASTKLTEEAKDRVIAFSGIPTVFAKAFNIESQYMAGMWKCYLPRALLWFRHGESETYRSVECYKAPSWSWMSLDGPINLADMRHESGTISCYCSLERVDLSLVDESNMTGQLKGGSINIRGHLLRLQELEDSAIGDEISLRHSDDDAIFCQLLWDEQDDNGNAVVSYFENPVTKLCHDGLPRGFSRTRTPLRYVNGSIFALPISFYSEEIFETLCAAGLVLYQPPHQLDVFHRVGLYRVGLLSARSQPDFAVSFQNRLNSQSPARSICII
jgi:hypothetical protein